MEFLVTLDLIFQDSLITQVYLKSFIFQNWYLRVKSLCEKAKEILMEESNVQPMESLVTILAIFMGSFMALLLNFFVSEGRSNAFLLPQGPYHGRTSILGVMRR